MPPWKHSLHWSHKQLCRAHCDSLSIWKQNQLNADVRRPNKLYQPVQGLVSHVWEVSMDNSFIFSTLFLEVYKRVLSCYIHMPLDDSLHCVHLLANFRRLSTRNLRYVSLSIVDPFYRKSVLLCELQKTVNVTTPADDGIQNFQILSMKHDTSFCQLVCFQEGNGIPTTLFLSFFKGNHHRVLQSRPINS